MQLISMHRTNGPEPVRGHFSWLLDELKRILIEYVMWRHVAGYVADSEPLDVVGFAGGDGVLFNAPLAHFDGALVLPFVQFGMAVCVGERGLVAVQYS